MEKSKLKKLRKLNKANNQKTVAAQHPAAPPDLSRTETHNAPSALRSMRKGRFLFGMLLTGTGMGLMLAVATGVLQLLGVDGRLSLPAVAICMIIGLMLLGGGFGVMATSAGSFDDDEFDRLMESGSVAAVTPAMRSDKTIMAEFEDLAERPPAAAVRRSDQVVSNSTAAC